MSTVPAFRSVILFQADVVRVFTQGKKDWVEYTAEQLSLNSDPSKELIAEINGDNVLALVSDEFAGHIQMVLPNKKEELTEEKLAEKLQSEFQIDLDAYEFASEKFPLGRDTVQVSVTGLEKEIFQKVQAWISQLNTKKFWIMPFAWFVSSLKSVEPALIAVAQDEDHVAVSHHYLGVDDARIIPISKIGSYAQSRKNERKETHLLYLQASAEIRREAAKRCGESIAVQALIPDREDDAYLAVIDAVMTKGSETLNELLHFVGEVAKSSPTKSKKEAAQEEKILPPVIVEENIESIDEKEVAALSEDELPKPVPPVLAEEDFTEIEPSQSRRGGVEIETDESEEMEASILAPVILEEDLEPVVTEGEPEPSAEPDYEPTLIDQLQQPAGVRSNADRYVEVPQQSRWKSAVLIGIIVAALTGLIGGAIFWSIQPSEPNQPLIPDVQTVTSATPTPTPSPEPVATSSAQTVDKKSSILILNATGIPGLAGKAKQRLASAGWTKVSTGNATGSYADATFIYTENEALLSALQTDLKHELTEAPQVKESQADQYAAVIILAENVSF